MHYYTGARVSTDIEFDTAKPICYQEHAMPRERKSMQRTIMNLRPLSRTLMLALSSIAICSCGLIFQGTTETISVESDPPAATVTMDNGVTMTTPFTINVPREQDLNFHFSKPGYQSVNLSDNSRVEPLVLIVDTIPLMIPWAIDAGTGAGFVHQRSFVRARLDPMPKQESAAQSPSSSPPESSR